MASRNLKQDRQQRMKMNSNINNHSAMTKDIPEIDDLTKGINDPDIMLSDSHQ